MDEAEWGKVMMQQVEIYTTLVVPLLKSCLEGYNATTVAYGQTGAGELLDCSATLVFYILIILTLTWILLCIAPIPGKTYTTLGPATSPDFFAPQNKGEQHSKEYDSVGILPRALRDLFSQLEHKRSSLNGEEDENHPAAAAPLNDEDNNPINGDSSHGSENGLGIPASKSPAPKQRPNNNANN